jgi:hypothetical protein
VDDDKCRHVPLLELDDHLVPDEARNYSDLARFELPAHRRTTNFPNHVAMQRNNIAPRQFMSLDEWTMIKAITSPYWNWMITLFRTTLGPGIIVLWRGGLNYPLVDEGGLTLSRQRRIDWRTIKKIGVSRSYVDGHVSEIRIHHRSGISKIPVHGLQNGQALVRTILNKFEQVDRTPARAHQAPAEPDQGLSPLTVRRRCWANDAALVDEAPHGEIKDWKQQSAMLRNTLARRSVKFQGAAPLMEKQI